MTPKELRDSANGPLSRSEMRRVTAQSGAKALYDELVAMLRKLEWVTWGDDGPQFTTCPICDVQKPGPHLPECELAALLRDLP